MPYRQPCNHQTHIADLARAERASLLAHRPTRDEITRRLEKARRDHEPETLLMLSGLLSQMTMEEEGA